MITCSLGAEAEHLWPVFDGHVDLVYALLQPASPALADSPFALPCLAAGGVRVVTSALYCADAFNGSSAAAQLSDLLTADERLLGDLPLIGSQNRLTAVWEGAGPPGRLRLLENADALLEFGVMAACAAGVVTVGLTHAGRNRLADGNGVVAPGGLTPAGQRLLGELAASDRVLDVAHLAEPGFWQVLAEYPGPIVCSHTGLRRFRDLPRNLSHEQLTALLARGGMVGLAFAPELLGIAGAVDLEAVFCQIDWVVQRFGAESVGLGSDFGGFGGECAGLQTHAGLPGLAARLRRAGYPEAAVARIMGENWRRCYAAVLPP